MKEKIWNLPVMDFKNRGNIFWNIVSEHFGKSKSINVIEIGVYQAGLLRSLLDIDHLNVRSYIGIDPYIGNTSDPYFGVYWKSKDEAFSVYQSSLRIFKQAGFQLHREFSDKYYRILDKNSLFDLVIVDGDHRFKSALWDLHHWFKRVRKNGILIADDYANPDTPAVTSAVNRFIEMNRSNIKRMGYQRLEFQNAGKYIPTNLTFVYFEPSDNRPDEVGIDFELLPALSLKLKHRLKHKLKQELLNLIRLLLRFLAVILRTLLPEETYKRVREYKVKLCSRASK